MKASAHLAASALLVFGASSHAWAAVKPGLEGAQDLFRRSHWEEARAHLRAQWSVVAPKDRPAATFLIGRSHVREAELCRAERRIGIEVGLAYLKELAGQRVNRRVALVPLFTAFYELAAGDNGTAARALQAAAANPALPAEWKAVARLRHAVALQRLRRANEAATVLGQPGVEARFWRMVENGVEDGSPVSAATRRERLLGSALLFRGARSATAEQLVAGVDLDLPDAEDRSDPKKILRFHDPIVAAAWERICWERAVLALRPQAIGGVGVEQTLAAYYTGQSLFELGALAEAAKFLKQASASSLPPPLQASARVLLAACSWKGRTPAAEELAPLWDATSAQADSLLLWDELRRGDLARTEPFASKLDRRIQDLLQSPSERPNGALVGRWALVRLRRGGDPGALLATLAEYRDDSNKNKIDSNDPLLLLALAAANHRNQQYPQALETLFELAKSFPGLRGLQWNLQGVYAARQKAGGETRISQ